MKGLLALVAGLVTAWGISRLIRPASRISAPEGFHLLDLNTVTAGELQALGLDEETATKVIESRPYRSKFDLINRYILTQPIYNDIKNRVTVDEGAWDKDVQIAG